MEFDRPGAQEHRPADLGVGSSLADQQGDLQFLGRQLLAPLAWAGHGLAAGAQLGPGPLGPRAGIQPVEDLHRGPELDARIAAPLRPAQPLPVGQVGARMLKHDIAALVQGDRLQEVRVEIIGGGNAPAPRRAGRRLRVGVPRHVRQEFRKQRAGLIHGADPGVRLYQLGNG